MKKTGKLAVSFLAAAILFSVNNSEAAYTGINSYNTHNNYGTSTNEYYSMEQHLSQLELQHEQDKLRRQYEEQEKDLKQQYSEEEAVDNSYHMEKRRFFNIYKDSVFSYYVDQPTAQWILCPYTADVKILDVWIAIFDNEDLEKLETNKISSIRKYYLEHYYINPETRQIQFLCELEISNGRPDNNVIQRAYKPRNWENLIPGSIEDSVYHHALRNVKKYNLADKNKREPNDVNRWLDRFHIITSSIAEGIGLYL